MTTSMFAMRARRRGMTLPELAIVLAIVGLLLGIAVPSVRNATRQYSLEEATQKFGADLVNAQTMAIKLNRGVTVKRVGTTGYSVDNGATKTLPTSVEFVSNAPDSVRFVSFGPPTTGAVSFTLEFDGDTQKSVSVNAGGRVIR